MYDVPQSRFVRHGPCEACGSKDNVAWYSNGSGYCFGCGRLYRGTASETLHQHLTEYASKTNTGSTKGNIDIRGIRSPPDDCDTIFPAKVIDWISQYELTAVDLIQHNVKWSQSREQLVYMFYGEGKDVVLWQARNFREGTDKRHRFFTGGTPEDTLATYLPSTTSGKGILVEDCISAIKVAMSGGGIGIPCFSAAVSHRKLAQWVMRLDTLHVWLDNDKFGEAVKISNRIKLLGCESKVINTMYDPKCYTLTEIEGYIK